MSSMIPGTHDTTVSLTTVTRDYIQLQGTILGWVVSIRLGSASPYTVSMKPVRIVKRNLIAWSGPRLYIWLEKST